VWSLPENEHDEHIDELLAEMCAYRAMHRHVGKIEEVFTPMGTVYNQTGKDLTEVEYVIGTGGVIINARDPFIILNKTKNVFSNTNELRPKHPGFLIDRKYILAAMGLLSQIDPLLALKIMKKHLKPINEEEGR
ncbi:MAG TPA: glutamate mutase L, partial [Bacillota bacterium]|nr:glutamate mutase L [Bacillota bacterium]